MGTLNPKSYMNFQDLYILYMLALWSANGVILNHQKKKVRNNSSKKDAAYSLCRPFLGPLLNYLMFLL